MDTARRLVLTGQPTPVSWEDACSRLRDYAAERDHVVAIDQPLVVPNATGMRPVDVKLARALAASVDPHS